MRGFLIVALVVAGGAAIEQARGQEIVYASNASFAAEANAPDDVVDFLLTASDTRLMNIEQGALASTNARSPEIKDYAWKMMTDQAAMLGYIKKMALLRDINLPGNISDGKKEKCDKLAGLTGKKFDRKFVKKLIEDRKQDLEMFKKAVHSSDPEVSKFAEMYLPEIENHLKQAKELKGSV